MDDRGRAARPVDLDEQASELRELGRSELLAALATDRIGPHEARGVVIGMLPTICDQPGEAIHAAASIATTARLGCCTRAAPRTRADMPAALRRGRRMPRAPESRRGCPTAALGAPRGPS